MNSYTYIDSPIGRLLLSTDGEALTGIDMDVPGGPAPEHEDWVCDAGAGPLPEAARQLEEYFAGTRRDFDLPMRLQGTEFQRRVWQASDRNSLRRNAAATASRRSASAIRTPRAPWDLRTAAIRSRLWCRAIE